MEVQPSVVHLDHGSLPSQTQMGYVQRSQSLHSNIRAGQMGEPGPFVPQRLVVARATNGGGGSVTATSTGMPRQPVYPFHQTPSTSSGRYSQSSATYVPPPQNPQQQSSQAGSSGPTQPPPNYRVASPYRPPQQVVHSTPDSDQPFKKIRVHDSKPELQQPLRIDVRDTSTAYTPQVEAISPTPTNDESGRATKEDLLQEIHKVDREIAQTEHMINQLNARKIELEEAAQQPSDEQPQQTKTDITTSKSSHQSQSQQIYAENRKKAMEAHNLLARLGPPVEVPLYNQPSDTPNAKEAMRKNAIFKNRLVLFLKKKQEEKNGRDKETAATYATLMTEWNRKVEKIENSAKRKAKDAKSREYFEKVFPELRKQREDKERFNRVGARVKSEADMEEIMDGLQEQEMEEKKMRSYAVVPPMMLDRLARKYRYINNNSRIQDLSKEFKEQAFVNCWTEQEHEIFKEKYLQHPKNFGMIASCLDNKSVADTVQHYYLTKRRENFKQLLRKSRQGRTRASRNNPGTSKAAPSSSVAAPEVAPPGVTTRLQREQLQKQDPSTTHSVPAVPGPTVPAVPITVAPTSSSSSATTTSTATSLTTASGTASQLEASPSAPPASPAPGPSSEINFDEISREVKQEIIDKGIESSDEENPEINARLGPPICIVCNTTLDAPTQSRQLPPNQAHFYGLSDKDVPVGSRVCNTCRCKSVRSRCMVCPLPTCPNAKGIVKRLRTITLKLGDLSSEVQETIIREFQIPQGTTKCCSACYARISRRLAPYLQSEEDSLRWTESEIEALRAALRQNGTSWVKVAEALPGKNQDQCKNFYFNCRKKYKLDAIVHEYYKTNFGEERKPAVTDEEESGSSTSSCDEQPTGGIDTSDTASAGSPAKHTESTTQMPTKEPSRISEPRAHGDRDYDSSATETADEGQPGESLLYPHLPGTSITAVNGPPSLSPPRTVQDLMGTVIEKQLMKSPGSVGSVCSGPPTITSILGTDSSYKRGSSDLATLSLVNSSDRGLGPLSPATGSGGPDVSKEGLVVVQMQTGIRDRREPEPETLDLSIKKRESPGASNSGSSSTTPSYVSVSGAVSHHSFALPSHSKSNTSIFQREPHYYQSSNSKPSGMQTPHLVMQTHGRPTHIAKGPPPGLPKPSPKMMQSSQSSKTGSITHGTPVQGGPRYETAMLRQQQTQHKETGSITQGTPVHHIMPSGSGDKRQQPGFFNYVKGQPTSTAGFSSPYPPTRQPTSYPIEQQQISRQIIMNDYITSQQMQNVGPRRVSMAGGDKGDSRSMSQLFYPNQSVFLPNRSTPETSSLPQLRQGVIQRHNTIPPSSQSQGRVHPSPAAGKVHYPPPGHEAFSSLVEAAVQQPSLPVPSADKKHLAHRESHHEGLGKTMADSLSSSRIMDHGRMSTNPAEQQRLRPSHDRDRDRLMTQREHEQRYHQREREQRESHHQQLQIQMQRQQQARIEQQRMEQQSQQARLEQQVRMDYDKSRLEQQRAAEAARIEAGQARLDYETKQQRHQQQLAAFIDAQQRATSERDRDSDWDREREATRILMGNYPRDRIQAVRAPAESPSPNRAPSGSGRDDSTMTAASLIDAIITHQINQTSDTGGPNSQSSQAPSRPGDRLFQGFLRDPPPQHSEANGKMSPLKRAGSPLEREPIKNISLAEHIGAIISKDYYPHTFSLPPAEARGEQSWQHRRQGGKEPEAPRERAERQERVERSEHAERSERQERNEKTDERQIIRMAQTQASGSKVYHEPVSPPEQWPARYYPEKPSHLSALDYVKNRIVEVMRTSEDKDSDEKGKDGGSPGEDNGSEEPSASKVESSSGSGQTSSAVTSATSSQPTATFSYPYSAIGVHSGCVTRSPTPAKPVDDPAPILSAQYDPLSDEDD